MLQPCRWAVAAEWAAWAAWTSKSPAAANAALRKIEAAGAIPAASFLCALGRGLCGPLVLGSLGEAGELGSENRRVARKIRADPPVLERAHDLAHCRAMVDAERHHVRAAHGERR